MLFKYPLVFTITRRPLHNATASRLITTIRNGQRQDPRRSWRNPSWHQQQRRGVFSLPRLVLGLVRLPMMLMGAGAGAAGYTYYRVNEFSKEAVPEWLRDSLDKAKDWVSSMELPNLDNLPTIPTDAFQKLFGASNQDIKTTSSILPGMEEAAKRFAESANAMLVMLQPLSMGIDDNANVRSRRGSATVHAASAVSAKQQPLGGQGGGGQMGPPDQDLMVLTKKLIEVRNLLKTIDNGANLQLPSIVVIGSQSSGKSSVLEAIVGHEFLPKGSNMVTRRPIELTLVHTADSKEEYGEFPQLGLGKVKDFGHIQKTLTDLNLAVSDTECVSATPIELRIYSPNIPNLTLVDLPGYIQIHNRNQPAVLKEKIAELCENYIREPNIILAVCAADVDLANSEALRASRRVDPNGMRTIGVVTKMDLVEPDRGVSILQNTDYPLNLGYIGVVCKGSAKNAKALIRAEDSYFRSHPVFDQNQVSTGTPTLRRRLMEVLEDHMGRGMYKIVDAVQLELDDARYQFKVQYNDRKISAESYVAEAMDSLKTRFKAFTQEFGKPQVREEVRTMLEKKIGELCDEVYWTDGRILNLPKVCMDPFWQTRMELTSASLTKSGIGRSSVQLVVDVLMQNMERILSTEQWAHHPDARKKVMQFSNDILRSKFHTTVDQVENTIKPYKFEVECSEQEWQEGIKRAAALIERTIVESQQELQGIKSNIGRRKLRNAMKYVLKNENFEDVLKSNSAGGFGGSSLKEDGEASGSSTVATAPFPAKVMESARDAVRLQHRLQTLQNRSAAIRSRQCLVSGNRSCCPEVFLEVVAEKLTYTAVMFIYVELLNEFFFQLPREVDNRLYYDLGRDKILQFARENPVVGKHLEVQERKATLELVMEKLKSISRR
ncbi:dynamin-like GTPase mgm1 [Phlyctochytrium planicorne]|nr:dynamin-like GTPase mgm1 [Phlyctochytrium planicorne]